MIPILYERDETAFVSNGLGRLNDCKSFEVTAERNGLFEVDFEMPVDGAHFDDIICGRIVYGTHDDTGNPQPFDIVSYEKPINGIVKFHAVHISYRTRSIVARAQNINSLDDALRAMTETAVPSSDMVFNLSADFTSTGYMAAFDNIPRSVRQLMGGIDGSLLDTYGGEYEFDRFNIILHKQRGVDRDFTIRYGVNMLDYQDDTDYSGTYTSCVPFWKGSDGTGAETVIIGGVVASGGISYTGRNECAALDLSEKFEDAPTVAELETMAQTYMNSHQTYLPHQSIKVDFVRLQDMGYAGFDSLLQCNLCDTVGVVFPDYGMQGRFKIVKTVYDTLEERYKSMELGTLSVSLSDALGISNSAGGSSGASGDDLNVRGDLAVGGDTAIAGGLTIGGNELGDFVVDQSGTGANNTWNYRKWASGKLECWARFYIDSMDISSTTGQLKYGNVSISNRTYPVAFISYPTVTVSGDVTGANGWVVMNNTNYSATQLGTMVAYSSASRTGVGVTVNVYAIGRWK